MMPPRGARGARRAALATLERISARACSSPTTTGRLLDAAAGDLNGDGPDSDDGVAGAGHPPPGRRPGASPASSPRELARAASIGQEAWVAARARLGLRRRSCRTWSATSSSRAATSTASRASTAPTTCCSTTTSRGCSTAEVAALFDELKAELVPMIATLARARRRVDDSLAARRVSRSTASGVSPRPSLERMGFDRESWRMDDAVHPFATGLGSQRRADHDALGRELTSPSSLYGAMHECGHGLYEAGVADALQRTPLGRGESLAMHESQSRLWENMVGRGRAFCGVLAPTVSRASSADAVGRLDADVLYRAVNRVHAVVHPRRGRRGDLRPAHHPALRARAGADRGAR